MANCASAFVITGDEIKCYSLSFDLEDKAIAYSELVAEARMLGALAIVTLNDARWRKSTDDDYLDGYYPGRLHTENDSECIVMTMAGPAIQNWTVSVPYERHGVKICVYPQEESVGGGLALLDGWAEASPKVT